MNARAMPIRCRWSPEMLGGADRPVDELPPTTVRSVCRTGSCCVVVHSNSAASDLNDFQKRFTAFWTIGG